MHGFEQQTEKDVESSQIIIWRNVFFPNASYGKCTFFQSREIKKRKRNVLEEKGLQTKLLHCL